MVSFPSHEHQCMKYFALLTFQDAQNSSANLLGGSSGRRWLVGRGDKVCRAEVVLELSKKARIGRIELGR